MTIHINNKLNPKDIVYSAPSSAYHQNRTFHKEIRTIDEKEVSECDNVLEYKKDKNGNFILDKNKAKIPSLWGFKDGHTYIWEVEQKLKEIKKEGISNQFNSRCENIPIESTNSNGRAP